MPGALTRWEPFAELAELRSRFDRMFDDFTFGRERTWTPAIDVVRENGNLVVRADIPRTVPRQRSPFIRALSGNRRREDTEV
jgi:hypothetical protein